MAAHFVGTDDGSALTPLLDRSHWRSPSFRNGLFPHARRSLKRPADSPDEAKARFWDRLVACPLSFPIYRPKYGKELPPNGRVGLEGECSKRPSQLLCRSVNCNVQEVGF